MSVKAEVLRKYLSPVFVETGSHQGDGIQQAIEAGFERIYSIEIHWPNVEYCIGRFKNNPEVTIIHGDSSKVLCPLIKDINKKITFLLDAHMSGDGTSFSQTSYIPIIDEICQIQRHHIKNHIVIVDDRRLLGTPEFLNLPEKDVLNAILCIHHDYRIRFDSGYCGNDIIVGRSKWDIKDEW